jgi:hypothetical protein
MSTDYNMVCVSCKEIGPTFASGSIAYGFKVWDSKEVNEWLGHRQAVGKHEGHDLRIMVSDAIPWDTDFD